MRVFPYVLIRVAGGTFERIESLNAASSVEIINALSNLRPTINQLKNQLSESLHNIIPSIGETSVRGNIIKIRRDIYNDRVVSQKQLDHVAPFLPNEINMDIQQYIVIKNEYVRISEVGKEGYFQEVANARKKIHEFAEDDSFQKGLLLSSYSLFKYGIPSYLRRNSMQLNKEELKVEFSLLKYASRMYSKTSPFSTFTNLGLGKISSAINEKEAIFLGINSKEDRAYYVSSRVRLNNHLYAYLKGLLVKCQELSQWLRLRPNPTLKLENGHYVYLTNNNNIEAFQKIPASPLLELFLALIAGQKEGMIYNEFVQKLLEKSVIDATKKEIEVFVDQLISYGFFEFDIGVSGTDPDWDIKLQEVLRPLVQHAPFVLNLVSTLEQLRAFAYKYEKADLITRNDILGEAFNLFRIISISLHQNAGIPFEEPLTHGSQEGKGGDLKEKNLVSENTMAFEHQPITMFYFKPERIFFEDTCVNLDANLDEKLISTYIGKLHWLLQAIPQPEQSDDREIMLDYFMKKYSKNARVALLSFYEDFYRDVKKNKETSTESSSSLNGGESKYWKKEFVSIIESQFSDNASQIDVRYSHIEECNRRIFDRPVLNAAVSSYGALIQLFCEKNDKGQLMGVVNGLTPGFGKMFSRFLHLFDESVTIILRDWNNAINKDDNMFAENCDASYFNANLHPALMPYEIRIPGGHNNLAAEKQLLVSDLQIKLNENTSQLELIYEPTGGRIFVFDLGFQNNKYRSQLFQLLQNFYFGNLLYLSPIIDAIGEKTYHPDNVEDKVRNGRIIGMRPRIVFEDQVILSRKTWFIPKEQLPVKFNDENDWLYFIRVNEWRLQNQLPEYIFIHISEYLEKDADRVNQDDRKPQLICFSNPLLVRLFGKLINRVNDILRVEEMLPRPEDLVPIFGKRYVTEYVLQWYGDV